MVVHKYHDLFAWLTVMRARCEPYNPNKRGGGAVLSSGICSGNALQSAGHHRTAFVMLAFGTQGPGSEPGPKSAGSVGAHVATAAEPWSRCGGGSQDSQLPKKVNQVIDLY